MAGGYMGKVLFADLSKGELKDEALDEKLCRDFIGGYGIGARIIYSRQKGGVDPLGPENTLGFMTGPLTGTDTPFGSRYTVVIGKSPLTDGWGDGNSGGDFGPYLKFAGYDGVFFTGVSEKPVYLFIKDGKAELRDATHLWGKDVDETEDMLKAELGKEARVASIGPAGEKLSLISAIMNNKGRCVGRSGVGAVMGSKKLKAVAVTGRAKVPVADEEKVSDLRKEYVAQMKGDLIDDFRKFGTAGSTFTCAHNGDSPVKNWGGVGIRDFPNANLISHENIIKHQEKRYACYQCPIGCGGHMKAGTGEYKYEAGSHRPEYETLCMFGTNCLNDNLESILKANDICNRAGLDTISTGASVAFAIECYENGLITKADTGGIEMTWGNHKSIVAMTEKIAKREGFGAVLANGVKVAAEKIGKGAEQYAIHVGGQELPAHDPKLGTAFATSYVADPTPGRHTQSLRAYNQTGAPTIGYELPPIDKYTYTGTGKLEVMFKNKNHLYNATGMCQFAMIGIPWEAPDKFLALVTGWQLSPEEITMICERIAAMRQAINLREGLSPKDFKLPKRAMGEPPLKEGPDANVTVDVKTLVNEYYKALDWDSETGKPSQKRLLELGLQDIAKDLWP